MVANGGAPIDPKRVEELTEPFRRLDRSGRGFGLGLSIVRSVAQAHHGHGQSDRAGHRAASRSG